MKCPKCNCPLNSKSYRTHVTRCKKTRTLRDMMTSVDDSIAPDTVILSQKTFPIGGVNVNFPYKPYPVQFQYMSKVMQALKNKQNALLESPTGTGKTLSLLCSVLSWLDKVKSDIAAEEYRASLCPVHGGYTSSSSNGAAANCSAYPDKENHSNSNHTHSNVGSNISSLAEEKEYRAGKRFGSIASVKLHNPVVKRKKQMDKSTRHVHIFIQDVYKNVRTRRVEVNVMKTEQHLASVNIDDQSDRKIFVEIPKPSVAMVHRELYLKPNTATETWILDKPEIECKPPQFIDETLSEEGDKAVKGKDLDDDDFVSPKKRSDITKNKFDESTSDSNACNKSHVKEGKEEEMADTSYTDPACICGSPTAKRTLPKIFFCTRTHRQIAQIIRELNKTAFKKVPMTILSSREHSCIHPTVMKEANKNEKCRDLCEQRKCKFRENVAQLVYHRNGIDQAWDVEDLCKLGKRSTACPYYASVEMMRTAEIVFAPYNYILDPLVVSQRELSLKDNVIIFDEGHNIEDVCRSSVGFEVTQFQLGDCIANLDDVIRRDTECYSANAENIPAGYQSIAPQLRKLRTFFNDLLQWILSFKPKLIDQEFEHSYYSFSGTECLNQLEALGITTDYMKCLGGWMEIISYKDVDKSELDFRPPVPKTSTLIVAEKFVLTFRILAAKGNASSFSTCAKKSPLVVEDPHSHSLTRHLGMSLVLTCLNPAVVFRDLSSQCHSVIVTSGTLSPMDTFQSELGTTFRVQHEGKHVVPRSNFMAVNLTMGPSGGSFNAGYKNAELFTFQDDVGKVVARVCKVVPHGVLVFFPSYRLLDKICDRWRATGLWGQIEESKTVICEPKGSNKNIFNEAMSKFDKCIDDGVLLLAVCRGKISEGVDFADNSARAVITIGLPFPNFKSTEVTDKRKYNDKFMKQNGLLSGQEWYTIQAFRAVNQALGRCLRHIKDWGSIIMIESRLAGNDSYWRSISRWIRDDMITTSNCNEALDRLEHFCQDKMEETDRGEDHDILDAMNRTLLHDTNPVIIIPDDVTASSTPLVKKGSDPRHPAAVAHAVPLFSDNSALPSVVTPRGKGGIGNNGISPESDDSVSVTVCDVTRDLSSSPDLFDVTDGETGEHEHLPERNDVTVAPNSSEDKRTLSPDDDDTSHQIVVKRRRTNRLLHHALNQSGDDDSDMEESQPVPSPMHQCHQCSITIMKKPLPSDCKTVKITDFDMTKIDVRALDELRLLNGTSTAAGPPRLSDMGVCCVKCGSLVGTLIITFIGDSVSGTVALEGKT